MKTKLSFNLPDFQLVAETSENRLIGGFSASVTGGIESLETMSNNCYGGNCRQGCGSWPKNTSCNKTVGCGVIH